MSSSLLSDNRISRRGNALLNAVVVLWEILNGGQGIYERDKEQREQWQHEITLLHKEKDSLFPVLSVLTVYNLKCFLSILYGNDRSNRAGNTEDIGVLCGNKTVQKTVIQYLPFGMKSTWLIFLQIFQVTAQKCI